MSLKQGMFPDGGTVSHSAWEICAELTIRIPTFVLLPMRAFRTAAVRNDFSPGQHVKEFDKHDPSLAAQFREFCRCLVPHGQCHADPSPLFCVPTILSHAQSFL